MGRSKGMGVMKECLRVCFHQELHHHHQEAHKLQYLHTLHAQELHRHTHIRPFCSRFPSLRRSSSPVSEFERACSLILLRRPPFEPIEITLRNAHFPLTPPNLSLLLNRLRSPKDALRIFLTFLHSNPSLPLETAHLNAVSRFWGHEKERFPTFLAILDELRKPNFVMTPRKLTAVIRGYGWAGLVDDVLEFISTSKNSYGFKPDFFHFSCALHVCIEENRLDVALQIFRQMDEDGCSPTFDTFQSLIVGLLKAARPKDASLFFVQLVSRHLLLPGQLPPSAASYIAIVNALIKSGDYHQALWLVSELNAIGYAPDYITCTNILKAISSTHIAHPEAIHAQTVNEVYDDMKTKELLPNVTSFKDFVRVHCKGETSSETQEMFDSMISTFDLVTSHRVSEKEGTMEIEKEDASSFKLSENEGARDTETELSDNQRPKDTRKDDVAFCRVSSNESTDTENELSENDRTMDTEKELLDNESIVNIENLSAESLRVSEEEGTMTSKKEASENETMNSEMDVSENGRLMDTEEDDIAPCRVFDSERTLATEYEIAVDTEKLGVEFRNVSENERTMNSENLGVESRVVSENERTMDTEKEDVADLALFDHVIYSLGMHAKSADAYELMLRMTQNSGVPTESTSMVLFDALTQCGKWLEAEHVLRVMMKWDQSPNRKTYNFWIQGACRAGHVDMVYLVLNECSRDDLVLDAMSFNVVVDKLCLARKLEEAKKISFGSKKNLRTLDVVAYCRMIYSFAKAGDLDVPQILLKEMVEMGFLPFAQPFTPLIDNLCKEGKMEEALSFLDDLGKKGCNPISSLYTYIIRGYCDKNQLQDAFKVIDIMKSRGITPEVKAHKALFERCMVAQKLKPTVQSKAS